MYPSIVWKVLLCDVDALIGMIYFLIYQIMITEELKMDILLLTDLKVQWMRKDYRK